MRLASRIVAAAALATLSVPALAQLGAATQSPPPPGLEEGQSSGYPKGRYAELEKLPDWGGIWFVAVRPPGQSGSTLTPPKLKGAYKEAYEAYRAEVLANDGLVKRERSNCSPPGMPIIMQTFQYPYEFLFTPGRVTINQEAWMQTRTIFTDGRAHQEDPDPTFMGDAIGHWEGDTLVVETIAINDALEMVRGMGHSSEFKVTERIHLDPANPDLLINEMLLEDPVALEEPYRVTVTYRRDRNGALIEFQCSENDRNQVDEHGNTVPF